MDPDRTTRPEKFSTAFYRTLLFSAPFIVLFSCGKKEKWVDVDPAFSKYIDAYTTGVVSKTTTVRIRLAADASTTHAVGEESVESLFDFTPSVKGKTHWLDARTVEFKPDSYLNPDQLYEVRFKLGKVTKVPDKFSSFGFSLKTVKPSFSVSDEGLRAATGKNKMSLSGEIETADVEDGAQVEKLLNASLNNNALKINWQHNDATKTHHFVIENIDRSNSTAKVKLIWNGAPANMDAKGEKEVEVPAAGSFKVLNVVAVNEAQQYASVQFSDLIAVGQDLTGLITVSDQSDLLSAESSMGITPCTSTPASKTISTKYWARVSPGPSFLRTACLP
jgi:alpha-2-macroglobulin